MENGSIIALYLALGVIIAAARLAGTLSRRFGQPRVFGELVIGVILGPTLLDLLHSTAFGLDQAHLQATVHELAELGVLLLMFKVGLDIHFHELVKAGLVAGLAGAIGAVTPLALAAPLVVAFGYGWDKALFTGVALAATSVSISAQVLLEIGVLRTKVGNALLATALIDDVVTILLASLVIAVSYPQEGVALETLPLIVVRMAVYIGAAFALTWFVLPRVVSWIHTDPEIAQSYGIPAFALIMALLFGWSAEYFGGVAAITGAFIAGVGFSRAVNAIKRPVDEAVANIAYVFLVPIFFVSVGLQVDLREFPLAALPFAGLLLLIAVLSKIAGCGLGARLGGFNRREAFQLGVCMISRGEVGLIIASLGLTSGAFLEGEPVFPSLFLVILLTTVLTPPLVRWVFRLKESQIRTGA